MFKTKSIKIDIAKLNNKPNSHIDKGPKFNMVNDDNDELQETADHNQEKLESEMTDVDLLRSYARKEISEKEWKQIKKDKPRLTKYSGVEAPFTDNQISQIKGSSAAVTNAVNDLEASQVEPWQQVSEQLAMLQKSLRKSF